MPPASPSLDYCEGLTRAGTPCKNVAGKRTTHSGTGRCYLHGGKSRGAPKGNKYAVTTGEHETLHLSALPPAQQALYSSLDTSPKSQHENEVRLLSVREHRILLRITAAELSETDAQDGMETASLTTHKGWNVKGKVDFAVEERRPILEKIMRLEDALTRVQSLKSTAIERLRSALKEEGGGEDRLGNLVKAINRSAEIEALEEETEDI